MNGSCTNLMFLGFLVLNSTSCGKVSTKGFRGSPTTHSQNEFWLLDYS